MNRQNELGNRLYSLRESRGLTKATIADMLDISLDAYSKIESGARGLKASHAIALADYYDVSCDYILRGIQAENLDVCSETCLTSETIDSLKARKTNIEQKLSLAKSMDESSSVSDFYEFQCIMYTAGNYLINAILQNNALLDALSRSIYDAIEAVADEISVYSFLAFSNGRMQIDAARFSAAMAFSNFFNSTIRNPNCVSQIYDISAEELAIAIEEGILDTPDN